MFFDVDISFCRIKQQLFQHVAEKDTGRASHVAYSPLLTVVELCGLRRQAHRAVAEEDAVRFERQDLLRRVGGGDHCELAALGR